MKKSIFQLASVALIGIVIGKGLRFGFNIVIARGLGAEALGTFAFGLVIVQAVSILARAGLDQAAQKYIPIFRSNNDSDSLSGLIFLCIITPLLIGSVLSLFIYSYTATIEQIIGTNISRSTRIFFLGIPILAFFRVTIIATRGFKETKFTVISRDFAHSLIGIVLIYAGSFVYNSLELTILGYLLSLLVGGLVATYYIYMYDDVSIIPTSLPVRSVFMFSTPLIIIGLSSQLVNWSDVFILGVFVSDAELGRYHAAYQTSAILTFVLAGVNAIFPSVASDLYSEGKLEQLEKIYSGTTKWILVLTTIGCVMVIAFAPTFLSVFKTVTPEAVTSLRILAIAQAITVSTGPVGYLLMMSGHERVETLNTMGVAVLNIVLNFVLVQEYQIVGAAIATGISMSIFNIVRVWESYHFTGIILFRTNYRNAIIPMFVGLSPVAIFYFLDWRSILFVFISGVCSLVLFVISLRELGLEESDRELLKSVHE